MKVSKNQGHGYVFFFINLFFNFFVTTGHKYIRSLVTVRSMFNVYRGINIRAWSGQSLYTLVSVSDARSLNPQFSVRDIFFCISPLRCITDLDHKLWLILNNTSVKSLAQPQSGSVV